MKTLLVINRLREFYNVQTNAKLAERLGVVPSTITNWKVRNSIDWILIFTKCESINLNWLVRGEGEMTGDSKVISKEPQLNNSELLALVVKLSKENGELTNENRKLEAAVSALKLKKETKSISKYDIAAES